MGKAAGCAVDECALPAVQRGRIAGPRRTAFFGFLSGYCVHNYPEAVFTPDHVSGELAPRGKSQIYLDGNFQIHGAAHELTLHFLAEVNNGEVVASTGLVIPYVQWGMKKPNNFLLKVSDKVGLTVQAAGRVRY